ncbi:hypothetical protein P7K49_013368 [Saguinus oedipus]|uniref:Uncharacterized protein n=1 Tax=Saguinus oedipus TaxID=9490 RepID=A0ABQ9VHU2_SAGOE|nr:hypothetical protein P7K49_013368 [Saguinus oedipus]
MPKTSLCLQRHLQSWNGPVCGEAAACPWKQGSQDGSPMGSSSKVRTQEGFKLMEAKQVVSEASLGSREMMEQESSGMAEMMAWSEGNLSSRDSTGPS